MGEARRRFEPHVCLPYEVLRNMAQAEGRAYRRIVRERADELTANEAAINQGAQSSTAS